MDSGFVLGLGPTVSFVPTDLSWPCVVASLTFYSVIFQLHIADGFTSAKVVPGRIIDYQ